MTNEEFPVQTMDRSVRLLHARVAIILFVVVGLITPASSIAIKQLHESYLRILGPGSTAREWRKERGGEFVLPARVQAILYILREHRVENFRYGSAIAQDPDPALVQRLAEGTYPIRLNAQAKHSIFTTTEIIDSRCQKIAEREGIVLAYCP